MRSLTFTIVLSVLFFSTAFAGVKTSISNGNWSNPATWSPAGIPFQEDTVIINSHVTVNATIDVGITWLIVNANDSITGDSTLSLHGNLKNDGVINLGWLAVGDGSTTINNGVIKGVNYATGNTTYDNFGSILSDTLSTSETPFINYGTLVNNNLNTSGDFTNQGNINVTSLFSQSGTFINNSGSMVDVTGQLIVSGNYDNQLGGVMLVGSFTTSSMLTNNGDISCGSWTHGSGTATGTTGKFCISTCFVNNASITGSVDICDATPSTFCDINMGSIAGTVTYCVTSPCATATGIEDLNNLTELNLYPNPVNDYLNIDSKSLIERVRIFDITGKVLFEVNNPSNKIKLNMPNGMYYVSVETKDGVYSQKLIKE